MRLVEKLLVDKTKKKKRILIKPIHFSFRPESKKKKPLRYEIRITAQIFPSYELFIYLFFRRQSFESRSLRSEAYGTDDK